MPLACNLRKRPSKGERIRLGVAVSCIEHVILPAVGQSWAQGVAARLREDVSAEEIGDRHGLLACCIVSESVWHQHAKNIVIERVALVVESAGSREDPDVAPVGVSV